MKESNAPAVGRTSFQKFCDKWQGLFYLIPWIMILTLFCVAIAFLLGGLAGVVLALICSPVNGVYITLLAVGICIFLTGFGILLMFPAVILTRWLARGTVWCCRKLASLRKGGKTA